MFGFHVDSLIFHIELFGVVFRSKFLQPVVFVQECFTIVLDLETQDVGAKMLDADTTKNN